MSRRYSPFLSIWIAVLLVIPLSVTAQLEPIFEETGATGLALKLRELAAGATFLHTTAHPDDEDNGLLVMLRRGRGLRTALLTVTRGDGGQNEIGPELFEAIGILRTEELMAMHRIDGAEQYFTAPTSSAIRSASRRRSRSGARMRSWPISCASSGRSVPTWS